MSMSYAMGARVLIPSFLRRIGCSSFVANSVVLQDLLLLSRLDSLPKLVVGRLEPKLNVHPAQSLGYTPQSSLQKPNLPIYNNYCPVFTVSTPFCVFVTVTLLPTLL
jgi:hypothetical protein